MPDLPVACTVGPDALTARRGGLLSELLRQPHTREDLASGYRFSFPATDDTFALVTRTVELERLL